MSGKVWQWCLSNWSDPYSHHIAEDIDAHNSGTRVVRGGSWSSPPATVRTASRYGFDPDISNRFAGFRIAYSIIGS